jgi:hypothetical protein
MLCCNAISGFGMPGVATGGRFEDRRRHIDFGVAERLAGIGVQLADAHIFVGRPVIRPEQLLGHLRAAPDFENLGARPDRHRGRSFFAE